MKKILFVAALMAAVVMGSCSKTEREAKAEDNDFKAKIENCTNPDSLSVYVEQAKAYAQKLVKEGKIDEAKEYMSRLEPVIKEKAPSLVTAFESVKGLVDKVPGAVSEAADSLGQAAKDSVSNAADGVRQAVADKVSDAKDAAKTAGENAVDKASDKVEKAAADAKDKLNNLVK